MARVSSARDASLRHCARWAFLQFPFVLSRRSIYTANDDAYRARSAGRWKMAAFFARIDVATPIFRAASKGNDYEPRLT